MRNKQWLAPSEVEALGSTTIHTVTLNLETNLHRFTYKACTNIKHNALGYDQLRYLSADAPKYWVKDYDNDADDNWDIKVESLAEIIW